MNHHKQTTDDAAPSEIAWLAGGGEMGRLFRRLDWTRTPVGPIATWPRSLRTAAQIMLHSRYPMFIWWGEELINFYNDGYIPVLGKRHPEALGRPASEIWSDIWHTVGPQAASVLNEGRATWHEELLLIMERNQFLEETYFTYSYSPIHNDEGTIGGLFCACTEDTQRVLGQRRLRTLRALAEQAAESKTAEEACSLAAATLSDNPRDLPFALLYLAHPESDELQLAGHSGLDPGTPASPPRVALSGRSPWPFAAVSESGRPSVVENLEEKFGPLPGGAWDESCQRAVVLPMTKSGQSRLAGFVVAGISPRLNFDDHYKAFMDLLAGHVTTAVANAEAYEEERRRAEALAQLDRAKTLFFSNVSHEFRTPLTLMLGPIEDSLADSDTPLATAHRERLETAHRNSLRLLKLVNTLLDFSRIEAGRVQASYEPLDLATFTTELASNFRSACGKAGLTYTVDCPPLPEPVYVDRDMWEKIVLNLISNAFKFTLEGEIQVTQQVADRRVELRVTDTGTGVPPSELPKLFERFHQVRGTKGRTQEGSGIGLALVQELVRLHGGEVQVESELGEGTTIRVLLPFGKSHLPAEHIGTPQRLSKTSVGAAAYVEEALRWIGDEAPATTCNSEPSETERRERFRVLLADDNADMREYVTRLLSPEYEVVGVRDGVAALEAARTHAPDLILTDVMMPGLDGFGLLQQLRADPETRELPVILLSARAGEEARVDGMKAGADDYLTKPFSARELLARVGTHLALARVRREAAESLRESEARFRNMADNAPVMIWVTEPDGTCTYLNKQWHQFTATTPEQGLGFGWIDSIHPDDRAFAKKTFVDANRAQAAFRVEYRLRRYDGEYRSAIDSAVPRFGAGGEFLGYIGSVLDITELKEVETRLREADRRKDEFLAMLAHELRNPLAPIRMGLEVMKMSSDDPAILKETRLTLERQTQQLITLVDDLLDMSRITRGKLELRRSRVNLEDVLRSAVEASKPILNEAAHHLAITTPGEPIYLDADPHRLAQVVSNLLNNAAKYTPDGGKIKLTAERYDEAVRISVNDNGIGIAPDHLENIFELFAQIDQPATQGYAGLGIGLTLVKSLVEMHDGQVTVESDGPNRGSTFSITLPVLAPTTAATPQAASESASPVQVRRRVLIVDDNKAATEMLSLLVKIQGHDFHTARDGLEALHAAREFRPDIILMDLGMPRMDGYEAARRIRGEDWGKSMTLVALTGWGQDEDKQKTADAGFDLHLVKPADPAQLKQVLAATPRDET